MNNHYGLVKPEVEGRLREVGSDMPVDEFLRMPISSQRAYMERLTGTSVKLTGTGNAQYLSSKEIDRLVAKEL
ncbi:MAG: hypothetical protein WCK90_02640 [archaeon]